MPVVQSAASSSCVMLSCSMRSVVTFISTDASFVNAPAAPPRAVKVAELDELLALGFRGREAEKVNDMLKELNDIEDETDELGIALARALFEHEDEMKPVSVMMWYQLIEWIGDLADYAEKVGDRLRLLIAK